MIDCHRCVPPGGKCSDLFGLGDNERSQSESSTEERRRDYGTYCRSMNHQKRRFGRIREDWSYAKALEEGTLNLKPEHYMMKEPQYFHPQNHNYQCPQTPFYEPSYPGESQVRQSRFPTVRQDSTKEFRTIREEMGEPENRNKPRDSSAESSSEGLRTPAGLLRMSSVAMGGRKVPPGGFSSRLW